MLLLRCRRDSERRFDGHEPADSISDFLSVENDLRAIEAVNQEDVQAALANDTARMMRQWTDDFVLLQAAMPVLRGRSVIAEAFRNLESSIEIVEYVLDIQEIKILGDYAFQWGGRISTPCVRVPVGRRVAPMAN